MIFYKLSAKQKPLVMDFNLINFIVPERKPGVVVL